MSQEANTKFYMNRRYEPMGGELDNNNGNTPISVPSISRHSNIAVSPPEDNFTDDLTLRVRSLLKSWEDDFPIDDSSNVKEIQDNRNSLHLRNEFQIVKSAECSNISLSSSKLKSHGNNSKLNPGGNFSKISSIDSLNSDSRILTRSGVNPKEFKNDNYFSRSSVSINERSNYDLNNSVQSFRKTSTPIQAVEDPVSYNDFSSSLLNVKNSSNPNKKNFNVPYEQPPSEASQKLSVTERSSKQDIKNSNTHSLLNASTDLYSRESSDKETERSWSEITIVAESYSESCSHPITLPVENRDDFCNANSPRQTSFKSSSKSLNPGARVKENIHLSKTMNNYKKDARRSVGDWRIEITDHDNTCQGSDKEYQFSDFLPNSNMSDLDQIDHDTPPLSASSMASSKRLEWDNGADIGYNVAAIRSKVKYRSIPRSEPEGISFINEAGTNTGSSQVILPSNTSMSSHGEPGSMVASQLDSVNSGASSMQDPSIMGDLLERSSSPGSLSRSDSKKSVIYNSFKNTLAGGKVGLSSDSSFIQTRKICSWPDLTLKSSVPAAGWSAVSASKILSKSDEQVGSTKCSELKLKLSPFSVSNASDDNINKFTNSSYLPERILPIGDYFPPESQSLPIQNMAASGFHSCKNCQSSLNENIDSSAVGIINKKAVDLYNLQEGDLESYEMYSVSPNASDNNISSQLSQKSAGNDWTNENVLHSDMDYITELSEFADYEIQSFNSKPFLLLSHDSSKLKVSNFPNIVENLLHSSSSGDHSTNGNLEVKPHIRWYPFPSTTNLQDIKNVSTQTSVSFIAKKPTDSPVQVATHNQKEHQDVSCEALGTSLQSVHLDKLSTKNLDIDSFPATPTLSNASVVNSKKHLKSQINFKEETDTSLLHETTEKVMTTSNYSSNCGNEVNDQLYLTKLSNSAARNLPSNELYLAHKPEVEKYGKMSSFENPTSSVGASNKPEQYQPFAVYSDARYDSDDSTYLHAKSVTSQPPSKYIFTGDIPTSFSKRRVGVGQCQTSLESASSKDSKEIQSDVQSKEIRNSSRENLSESSDKDESVLHSSEMWGSNYSTSSFSRFVSHQFNTEGSSIDHNQSKFQHNLDDTIPLTSACNQNSFGATSDRYNASLHIPLEISNLSPDEKGSRTLRNFHRRQEDGLSLNTNNFIKVDRNLSRKISENSSFSVLKQRQNQMIQKSHSDPLISLPDYTVDTLDKDSTLLQSQLPPVSRKIDFELSRDSESGSCQRIESVETSSVKHSNMKDTPELHSFNQNDHLETSSNSFIYKKGQAAGIENLPTSLKFTRGLHNSFSNRQDKKLFNDDDELLHMKNITPSSNSHTEAKKFTGDSHKLLGNKQGKEFFIKNRHLPMENITQNSNIPTEDLKFSSNSHKSSINEHLSSESLHRSFEHLDVVDEVHQIPTHKVLSRLRYFDAPQKNYASVGIQVSQSISGSEKCSFCNKNKDSHLNCCFKKEIFKAGLDQTLAKRISEMKSKYTTSFCAFPTGCYCCCNKTLQEAFNFHRSEIVERIELRKKEVEEKCKNKLFLYAPPSSQTKPKQPSVKLSLKPVADINGRNCSSKEKKKIKKSESSCWKNASSQKGRQRNLNKYNRIMSKIYSQRLKNETLQGKVNHQRHEILIKS